MVVSSRRISGAGAYSQPCSFAAGLLLCLALLLVVFVVNRAGRDDTGTASPGAAPSVASLLDGERTTTGVTGELFSGAATLSLPTAVRERLARLTTTEQIQLKVPGRNTTTGCKNWGVVTTIFAPSDSVKGVAALKDWCLVVATDKSTPMPFALTGDNVVVLDVEAQEEIIGNAFPDLFALLSWKHFGRKNLGYLYAIASGAEAVWDFDDDNALKEGLSPFPPGSDTAGGSNTFQLQQELRGCNDENGASINTFNVYPEMGAAPGAWPRGYPLNLIKRKCGKATFHPATATEQASIAVYQSLADHEPDVDGIFRLTQPIPFDFDKAAQRTLLLPAGTYCPWNAQATLFLQPALWSLLLPVSVHGRVSDIWRSYIAQRLLWDVGKTVAFMPPRVTQFRNPHNPLADMRAEEDLYYKSLELIRFLSYWQGKGNTIAERAVELASALYERQYIGLRDVLLTAEWMSALKAVGYAFPPVVSSNGQPLLPMPPPFPAPGYPLGGKFQVSRKPQSRSDK
jgi:STELLO glycosyltransferases